MGKVSNSKLQIDKVKMGLITGKFIVIYHNFKLQKLEI